VGVQQREVQALDLRGAGIDDMLDAGVGRGLAHGRHLLHARGRVRGRGRHQQQLLHARERRGERREIVIIGLTDVDPTVGEIGGLARITDADRQRRVGRAAQDLVDDQTAELAVGTGDQEHAKSPRDDLGSEAETVPRLSRTVARKRGTVSAMLLASFA
jgi:hypothetical protein